MPFTKSLKALRIAAAVVCLCSTLLAAAPASIWIDVPFIRQSREGCGAASIAMVMRYWNASLGRPNGEDTDDAKILGLLHSEAGHGIYASEMVNYFESHGYRVLTFEGKWQDFEEQLSKGRPLIVGLQPRSGAKVLHYVVVSGVEKDFVLFNDPADRKLAKLDKKSFEKQWGATNKWTLLALPQSDSR